MANTDSGSVITVSLDQSFEDTVAPIIEAAVQHSIEASLAIVRDRWQTTVQNELRSTRPLYLQGLQWDSVIYPLDGDLFSGAVQLKGKFPNMLETGFEPFDEKIGFSKSPRIKKKDNGGWFLTIPIRHSTPGSFMYGNEMPKDIYGVAKKLNNGEHLTIKGKGDVSWKGYQRRNTTYDGLTRIVKSYGKAKQSQYVTFRRVSDKSDPLSWWHPGYKGIHVVKQLEPFAQKTFSDILAYNLNNI